MAYAKLKVLEAKITLELNELEAAVVLGIVGTAKSRVPSHQATVAISRIAHALSRVTDKRMTDYSVRVGTHAVIELLPGTMFGGDDDE